MCFELNELKRASFFFLGCFEWSHAELGLRGEHIAPVRSCSEQQSPSVVLYIFLHPPIHPSGWCAHIAMQSQRTLTNTLSKASLEPKLRAICKSIFYSSITCNQQKKHTCVFTHEPANTLKGRWAVVISAEWFVKSCAATHGQSLYWTHTCEWARVLFFFFHAAVF